MIFKSEKWELDTDKITVRNVKDGEAYNFYTDHIRYHLHYSEENYPERLQKLVDEGKILAYLEELELKIIDAINDQTEIFMADNKEYQIALEKGDLYAVGRIGNMLREQSKEGVYADMVYV